MTVIIKYPRQNKKANKEFFERKNRELSNLDWAKWGGWFDTDGYFSSKTSTIGLRLKDREPVELFCKIFETSLTFLKHKTITPNGAHYVAEEYIGEIRGSKALWFAKNISKYMFSKIFYIKKYLNEHNSFYIPYQHTFTKDELISYISSALQGDGTFYDRNKNNNFITLNSSNINYLTFIKNELHKYEIVFGGPYKGPDYNTKKGIKNMFQITLKCKQKEKMIKFYEAIIPKIEMTRKRNNAIISLEYLKQ